MDPHPNTVEHGSVLVNCVPNHDPDLPSPKGMQQPCTWSIAGMEPGVYPITRSGKDWWLDRRRRHGCQQRIKRYQFPIAPDYARTAYSAQGLTLEAAAVDLNFNTAHDISARTGYVAVTRVRCADDIILLQAFERETFQRGVALQPKLMLAKIKAGHNWEANNYVYRNRKHTPHLKLTLT